MQSQHAQTHIGNCNIVQSTTQKTKRERDFFIANWRLTQILYRMSEDWRKDRRQYTKEKKNTRNGFRFQRNRFDFKYSAQQLQYYDWRCCCRRRRRCCQFYRKRFNCGDYWHKNWWNFHFGWFRARARTLTSFANGTIAISLKCTRDNNNNHFGWNCEIVPVVYRHWHRWQWHEHPLLRTLFQPSPVSVSTGILIALNFQLFISILTCEMWICLIVPFAAYHFCVKGPTHEPQKRKYDCSTCKQNQKQKGQRPLFIICRNEQKSHFIVY